MWISTVLTLSDANYVLNHIASYVVLCCSFPHNLMANYVEIHIQSELGIILCEFPHNYIFKLCGFQHKLHREHFADYVEYYRANYVVDHNI